MTPSRAPLGLDFGGILEALAAFLSPGAALGSFLDGSENGLEKRRRSSKGYSERGGTPGDRLRRADWSRQGVKGLSKSLLNGSLEPVPVNTSMSKT